MSLHRHYTDVNGNKRVLEHFQRLEGVVGYRKTEEGIVYSPASRWKTEDGSIIQIPDEAWSFTGIDYEDVVTLERK